MAQHHQVDIQAVFQEESLCQDAHPHDSLECAWKTAAQYNSSMTTITIITFINIATIIIVTLVLNMFITQYNTNFDL